MQDQKPERVVIKKYANRRMYDVTNSRYVNLSQIAEMIREGRQVEVHDAKTGEDLTKVTLTQIIMEEERDNRNLLPVEFLHQVIQFGESAYGGFMQQILSQGMEAYRQTQHRMQETVAKMMGGWPIPEATAEPKAPPSELDDLRKRLAELEKKLAERS